MTNIRVTIPGKRETTSTTAVWGRRQESNVKIRSRLSFLFRPPPTGVEHRLLHVVVILWHFVELSGKIHPCLSTQFSALLVTNVSLPLSVLMPVGPSSAVSTVPPSWNRNGDGLPSIRDPWGPPPDVWQFPLPCVNEAHLPEEYYFCLSRDMGRRVVPPLCVPRAGAPCGRAKNRGLIVHWQTCGHVDSHLPTDVVKYRNIRKNISPGTHNALYPSNFPIYFCAATA